MGTLDQAAISAGLFSLKAEHTEISTVREFAEQIIDGCLRDERAIAVQHDEIAIEA